MRRRTEPDLQYCPECDDEYRPGITRCAACNVPLISGAEMLEHERLRLRRKADRGRPPGPEDEMVGIRKGPVIPMKALQAVLRREGIPSLTVREQSCAQGCGCGGPQIVVQIRRTDLEEALLLLEQEHLRTTGLAEHDTSLADAVFDPSAETAVCPACGHSFFADRTDCPDCGLCFG